jgi:O-antigen ligase
MYTHSLTTFFKQKNYRASTLVLLLLFAIPFGFVDVYNGLLIVLLLHSLIYLKKEDWKFAFTSPVFWAVGSFYLLYVLNLFHAEDMAEGGRQLEIKAPFFLGSLLIVANTRGYISNFKEKALNAFLYGTLGVSVSALLVSAVKALNAGSTYFLAKDGVTQVSYFTYVELSEVFSHPGYFATFVGFAIFITLRKVFQTKGRKKIYQLLILAFLFVMLFLLQGRINILAMAGVFGICAIYYAFQKKMYIVLAIPAVLVAGLIILLATGSENSKNRFAQVPNFDYDITGDTFNSATYRLAEWTCAADVIRENFWFGTGVGDNRQMLWDAYAARGFKKGVEEKYIAHNQYIETMIACGVIGLCALVVMLFYFGRQFYRIDDLTSLACLLFLAICMLTESMFERAWAITLFSVFFPLMLVLNQPNAKEAQSNL